MIPPKHAEELSTRSFPATTSGLRKGPDRIYSASVWLAFALCIAQTISLPVLVTFDGYWYAKLAEVFGTSRFGTEWDYLRTPLFPMLLKASFWLFGRQPLAVCALQCAFGFGGICLLGAALKRLGRPVEAAIVVLLLACFPTLITYEHALLTEAGTFFFLALLVYVMTVPGANTLRLLASSVGVLSLGYYHRSSLLYLSPAVALVYAVAARNHRQMDGALQRRTNRRIFVEALAVLLLPFLLAYPWQRNPLVAERTGHVLLYGLAKQAVIPPEDPLWASATGVYREAIDRSMIQGRFPLSGVQDQLVYLPLDSIHKDASQAGSVFIGSILRYPRRYALGFLRTSLLFAHAGSTASDTATFQASILSGADLIAPHPTGFPPLDSELVQHHGFSVVGVALARAIPLYNRLVFLGVPATFLILVIAVFRKDAVGLTFGIVPLAFLLLNALLLSTQDRMAAPAYPLLLVNLVVLPGWLWNRPPPFQSSQFGRAVRLSLGTTAVVLFYTVTLFLAESSTGSVGLPAATTNTRMEKLSDRKRINQALLGNVDRVGGSAPRNGRAVVSLSGKSEIEVEGWAIDQIEACVGAMMTMTVNGRAIACDYGKPRPDVAAALHNDGYINSGYICHVPATMIKTGENTLQSSLATRDSSCYTAEPITVAVTPN